MWFYLNLNDSSVRFSNNKYIFFHNSTIQNSGDSEIWLRMSHEVAEIKSYRAVSSEGLTGAENPLPRQLNSYGCCKKLQFLTHGSFHKAVWVSSWHDSWLPLGWVPEGEHEEGKHRTFYVLVLWVASALPPLSIHLKHVTKSSLH